MNHSRLQFVPKSPSKSPGRGQIIFWQLMAGVVLFGIAQYMAVPAYGGVHNGDTVTIETTRGEHFFFHIDVPGGASSDWAAPGGLYLTFADPSVPRIRVVPPQPQDWGNALTSVGSNECGTQTITISFGFEVPQLPGPATQTIEGQIAGTLIHPVPKGGCTFTNESVDLHIAVHLELVSSDRYAQLKNDVTWHPEGGRVLYFVFLLALLGDILLLGALLVRWGVVRLRRSDAKKVSN